MCAPEYYLCISFDLICHARYVIIFFMHFMFKNTEAHELEPLDHQAQDVGKGSGQLPSEGKYVYLARSTHKQKQSV